MKCGVQEENAWRRNEREADRVGHLARAYLKLSVRVPRDVLCKA